jgi:N-sulfoglucosamine sulfohydrolase
LHLLPLLLFLLLPHALFSAESRRPNILWLMAENIGPDLACYGYPAVNTPNLDKFAQEGMRYRLAFSTSPFCSPSRSAMLTGMYQTSIGAHHHRSHFIEGLDADFTLPAGVRPFTQVLREAGYYCANIKTVAGRPVGTGKTDFNFKLTGEPMMAESSGKGRSAEKNKRNNANFARAFAGDEWTELPKDRPFYAQVNLPTVERTIKGWTGSASNPWNGQVHPAVTDPSAVTVPPYYPDHEITRKDWAGYLDAVSGMDDRAGEILRRLEADGLADDTIVIFFADNGRLEHRGHGFCYDSGDRVPFIIRWPKHFPAPRQYRAGTVSDQLISLIDLTATTLSFAGLPKPAGMQSQVFIGDQAEPRTAAFSARDRHDECVNRIRAIRTERWRYIRNFMPGQTWMAWHRYKDACYPVVPLMRKLFSEGKLTGPPLALMASAMPAEELYDTEADPHEINNLAESPDPAHQKIRAELRQRLEAWIEETRDQGRTPEDPRVEAYMQKQMHELFGTPGYYPASWQPQLIK